MTRCQPQARSLLEPTTRTKMGLLGSISILPKYAMPLAKPPMVVGIVTACKTKPMHERE